MCDFPWRQQRGQEGSAPRTFPGNREISCVYTCWKYNMVCDKYHMSGADEEKGGPGEFKGEGLWD